MDKLENITFVKTGKIGLIRLNRPEFLNALCDKLINELNQTLDIIEQDDQISVVLLTGSEKAFAAGADISEMSDKNFIDLVKKDFILPWEAGKLKTYNCAVSGYALGGG